MYIVILFTLLVGGIDLILVSMIKQGNVKERIITLLLIPLVSQLMKVRSNHNFKVAILKR